MARLATASTRCKLVGMQSEMFHRFNSVPTIARIIITQATRRRAKRDITDAVFEEQIRRVRREELEPKGMTLLVRELPDRRTRFLIKEKATGAVFEMMDFAADGDMNAGISKPRQRRRRKRSRRRLASPDGHFIPNPESE